MSQELASGDFTKILQWLEARTGLCFRKRQRAGAMAGIRKVMQRSGISDPAAFAKLLEFDMDILDELIVELTVGETYFFRETGHFEFLRREVLPEIRRRRGEGHSIRIWSAACASGEEPYSLAMLCDQEGLSRHVAILATDISPEALAKAREATYRQWSLRGPGAATAREYLVFREGAYHMDERIARQVKFEFLNLALDVYPSHATGTMGVDVIFCRNVLIYFAKETVKLVIRRLYESLAPGGWLITGSADPPIDSFAGFDVIVSDDGVFYRKPIESAAKKIATDSDHRFQFEVRAPVEAPSLRSSGVSSELDVTLTAAAPIDGPAQPARIGSVAAASDALSTGDYRRAAEITAGQLTDPAACVLHIKALANFDTPAALRKCAELVERHSLSPELHYLHAVLLAEVNLDIDAMQALQRVLFLDSSLAIAHFTLGTIRQRRGALAAAKKSFRNARNLCETLPAHEVLPMSDQTAGSIIGFAEHWLRVLGDVAGSDG